MTGVFVPLDSSSSSSFLDLPILLLRNTLLPHSPLSLSRICQQNLGTGGDDGKAWLCARPWEGERERRGEDGGWKDSHYPALFSTQWGGRWPGGCLLKTKERERGEPQKGSSPASSRKGYSIHVLGSLFAEGAILETEKEERERGNGEIKFVVA